MIRLVLALGLLALTALPAWAAQVGPSGVELFDEAVSKGVITKLDAVGAGIDATVSGTTGTLTVLGLSAPTTLYVCADTGSTCNTSTANAGTSSTATLPCIQDALDKLPGLVTNTVTIRVASNSSGYNCPAVSTGIWGFDTAFHVNKFISGGKELRIYGTLNPTAHSFTNTPIAQTSTTGGGTTTGGNVNEFPVTAAGAAGNTTLNDTSKTWASGVYAVGFLNVTGGVGYESVAERDWANWYVIKNNTATQIQISGRWWNGTPGLQIATPTNAAFSTATTGGTLAAGTYYYRVACLSGGGTTLASTETSQVTTGTTSTVTVNWTALAGCQAYKVYGRTTGAELLMATYDGYIKSWTNVDGTAGTGSETSWTDTGSVTPSGALPGSNTTAATTYDVYLYTAATKINATNMEVTATITSAENVVLRFITLGVPTKGMRKSIWAWRTRFRFEVGDFGVSSHQSNATYSVYHAAMSIYGGGKYPVADCGPIAYCVYENVDMRNWLNHSLYVFQQGYLWLNGVYSASGSAGIAGEGNIVSLLQGAVQIQNTELEVPSGSNGLYQVDTGNAYLIDAVYIRCLTTAAGNNGILVSLSAGLMTAGTSHLITGCDVGVRTGIQSSWYAVREPTYSGNTTTFVTHASGTKTTTLY